MGTAPVALVTGALGFVGRHLCDHLTRAGDEVVASDVRGGGPDLRDRQAVAALVSEVSPSLVYHLGGQADVGLSWTDPVGTVEVNVLGTMHLLAACVDAAVPRVLVASSAEVYGVALAQRPLAEEDPMRPATPYGASKAAAEMLCVQAYAGHGLGVVRARGFSCLGPGQPARSLTSAVLLRLLEARRTGASTIPVGNLEASRDVTDVRDMVRALRLLATSGRAGEAYNVCSGTAVASSDLVDRLVAAVGGGITPVLDPDLVRPVETPWLVGDPRRITEECGWRPEIRLERTVRDLVASLT